MNRASRWAALVAAVGVLAACGPGATDPGIPADTAGPLTLEQAELLIETPLADLAATVSERAEEYADFSADAPAQVEEIEGTCFYISTLYRSAKPVDADGWGTVAGAVRPQMEAWEMGTDSLEDEERAIGAGLDGQNPHNLATLSVRAWNEHRGQEVDGPALGLEMRVEVPLADGECEQAA